MMVSIGTYLGGVWAIKWKILCWKALLEDVASEGNLSLSPLRPGTAILLPMMVCIGTYLGGVWEVK
jgi:hypothetical protein